MSSFIEKHCPRCQYIFECKVEDILNCQCSTVKINKKESKYLKTHFKDCLCSSCLEEIKNKFKIQSEKIPSKKELIENEDYYFNEKGHWVFTASYHLKRGYCCGNNCKHCPY